MSAKAVKKTNAMRELERAGVTFCEHTYEVDESDLSGVHVCAQLGEDPAAVFKTLVCATASGGYAVCCIPVAETLDLKAAARIEQAADALGVVEVHLAAEGANEIRLIAKNGIAHLTRLHRLAGNLGLSMLIDQLGTVE